MPAFKLMGEQGAGRLDAALALPASDYYARPSDATAAMFVALIDNHPFQDGNKRFAIVATTVFLFMNNLVAVVSGEEWEELALEVARSEVETTAVADFLDGRLFDPTTSPPDAWNALMKTESGQGVLTHSVAVMRRLAEHNRALGGPERAD